MLEKLFSRYKIAYIAGLVYILPIIIAGRMFNDDIGRATEGYTKWGVNGRPLSDWIMEGLSFGFPISNLSPFTIIIALLITVLCGALLAEHFGVEDKAKRNILALSFIISPFYLENLSYQFDSLPMALSLLFASIAFTIQGKFRPLSGCAFGTVLLIGTMCLYQPSINIYIILVCFAAILAGVNSESGILITALYRAISLLVAQVIYSLAIVPTFIEGDYNTNHSIMITEKPDPVGLLFSNIQAFYDRVSNSLDTTAYVIAVALVILLSLIWMKSLFTRNTNKNKLNFALDKLTILIALPVIFICIAGPLLLLYKPVTNPRVLLGVNAIVFIGVFCATYLLSRYWKYLMIVPMVYAFSLSAVYGNASTMQKRLDEFRAAVIAKDINNINRPFKNLVFIGMPEISKVSNKYADNFPVIRQLITPSIRENWVFANYFMRQYGIYLNYIHISKGRMERDNLCSQSMRLENKDYTIMYNSDTIVVDFTKCNGIK
ncbi:glucosyltransferase domain-containing protein [Enterobacter hormaechei]|nr:glucosyltransferase domain-containing protein [Enterobacter hormaechei]